MNLKKIIYTLTIPVFLFNCSSNSSDDLTPAPDPEPDPEPTEKITYNGNVKSIINSNCVQCHANPPQNGAPFSLVTFNDVKNRVNSIIPRINNATSPMPPSGQMSSSNRNTIQQWKDDGLLEN